MNKKAISDWEYLQDLIITTVFALLAFFVIFMVFSESGSIIDHKIIQLKSETSYNEGLSIFLQSPFSHLDVGESETVFIDGKTFKVVNFDKGGMSSTIKIDSVRVVDFEIDIISGRGSNIAVIGGSADNIIPELNKLGIYPVEIMWEELNNDFGVLFIGCSSVPDIIKLRAWLSSGKRVITTDYSISIIEGMIGSNSPLYTDEKNVKTTGTAIVDFGNRGKLSVPNVFWRVFNRTNVNILGEYVNAVDDGYPYYSFNYNGAEIYHFTGHFDGVLEKLGKGFVENLFKPIGNGAGEPALYIGDSSAPIWEYRNSIFNGNEKIHPTGRLKEYLKKNCNVYPCDVPIKMSASSGSIQIKVSVSYAHKEGLFESDITMADAIVNAYENDDFESIESSVRNYLSSEQDYDKSLMFTIFEMPEQGAVFRSSTPGFLFADTKEIAKASIPLIEPGTWLSVRLTETQDTSGYLMEVSK